MRIEKEFFLRSGGRFRLITSEGDVNLSERATDRVTISMAGGRRMDELYDVEFLQATDSVDIKVELKAGMLHWGRSRLKFDIKLPLATVVEVETGGGHMFADGLGGTLSLRTGGGDVKVLNAGAGVQVASGGGQLILRHLKGDTVVETKGGDIQAEQVLGSFSGKTGGGSVKLSEIHGCAQAITVAGSIRIVEAAGHVTAMSGAGKVAVSFAEGNMDGGLIELGAGEVVVAIRRTAKLTVSATVTAGTVKSTIPLHGPESGGGIDLRGAIGGGGKDLTLRVGVGILKLHTV
jgi:DUF4097 and DUF4098 domain-containing protein YvlB